MKIISNQDARSIHGGASSDNPLYKVLLWGALAKDVLNLATNPEALQEFKNNSSMMEPPKDGAIGPNKSDLK